jgi:hypothetical protein
MTVDGIHVYVSKPHGLMQGVDADWLGGTTATTHLPEQSQTQPRPQTTPSTAMHCCAGDPSASRVVEPPGRLLHRGSKIRNVTNPR